MKKLILTTFAIFIGLAYVNAQEIADNAIGLRLGDSDGLGTEISYQRALGDNNRLEVGLGWSSRKGNDNFKLTGLYQWVWLIDGDFNWYAGAGGGIGSSSYNTTAGNSNEVFGFIASDVGIEYSFDFPLLLSLDVRPEFNYVDSSFNLDFGVGLGIRYQF